MLTLIAVFFFGYQYHQLACIVGQLIENIVTHLAYRNT